MTATLRNARPAAPVWWTEADQAELDVAIWELVLVLDEHRASCAVCQEDARAKREGDRYRLPFSTWPCAVQGRAIEALVEWRERRRLVSKAEYLRRRHLVVRLDELERAA